MEAKKYSSLDEVQKAVDDWISSVGGGYFSELTNMVVLTEEVGELARVMARVYGDQVAKPGDLGADAQTKLSEELADVLWVVACLANQTGVNLTDAFAATLAKKQNATPTDSKNKRLIVVAGGSPLPVASRQLKDSARSLIPNS